jgi:hypothetical protein
MATYELHFACETSSAHFWSKATMLSDLPASDQHLQEFLLCNIIPTTQQPPYYCLYIYTSCSNARTMLTILKISLFNVVRSDLYPVLLTLLLGTTNGHLASLTSMHMPSLLPPAHR